MTKRLMRGGRVGASGQSMRHRTLLATLLLAFSSVPLATWATTDALAACTVDVGPECEGTCAVNAGNCGAYGRCLVNAADCEGGGWCEVNAGTCAHYGNCLVNVGDCAWGCTVNAGTCRDDRLCRVNLPGNCLVEPDPENCEPQSVHTYGSGGSVSLRSALASTGQGFGARTAHVWDSNLADCGYHDQNFFDGDYDAGVGGAFFGYGAWVDDECYDQGPNYWHLNSHGPNVVVEDMVFGRDIWFVTGEDDQTGPVKFYADYDGDGYAEALVCETDGSINPGDPATDPTADPDDCLSEPYLGVGQTCGTGGGDGGYWVFLYEGYVEENGGVLLGNTPTAGTITAY